MRRAQAAWLKRIGMPKRLIKYVGFGYDEQIRAQRALAKIDVDWERLEFPAIRHQLPREAQRAALIKAVGSAPMFSMCTTCPFKDPKRWKATPENQLNRVYEIDEAVRDLDEIGLTEGQGYLSSQLIPIKRLIRNGELQPTLPGFEGSCDGGSCFL
jgi:hypothetical protein